MKLDNLRHAEHVLALSNQIKHITKHHWKIMEICGGQTHTIAKFGLFDLLPPDVELIHGPGCPVCVTPKQKLDQAIAIAKQPNVIFCTFGDMLRVPGSELDLLSTKALGADIRMIYSPLEAIKIAEQQPDKEVILFAVGFETTAPAHAFALKHAVHLNLNNFSIFCSLVMVPPAIEYILSAPNNVVQGFLAAGHVCTIMGDTAYHPLSQRYNVPIIITGFEPIDIMKGIFHCVWQLENNQAFVENQYTRSVQAQGNFIAQQTITEMFDIIDMPWQGIGTIAKSGLQVKDCYAQFDAEKKFSIKAQTYSQQHPSCISGQILQGLKKPFDCAAFGKACTPDRPLGAPMVSSEGACSAYYRYCGAEHEKV